MSNKSQHLRSVETLGISGNDDEAIIAEIQALINRHTPKYPYGRNTLLRIKDLLEEKLWATLLV